MIPNSEKIKPIALAVDKLGLSESPTYNDAQDYTFSFPLCNEPLEPIPYIANFPSLD